MCSVDLDNQLPEMVKAEPDQRPDLCKKCLKNEPVLCLRTKDWYCKDCFLTSSVHKFRSTLGKHKVMKHGDQVLVGFNGDAGAVALLHLISLGTENSSQKRLMFETQTLVMDEGALFFENAQDRLHHVTKIQELAKRFAFPIWFCALEQVYSENEVKVESTPTLPEQSLTLKLRALFDQCQEASAKEHMLRQLKRRLLARAATALKTNKIFTAESSTSLACSLMSGVACGRGPQLVFDTGFIDERAKALPTIRAMREFSKKEIALYNKFHLLPEPLAFPAFSTKKETFFSITKLTEDFILGLQENFPATIPTIFRTGDKFQVDPDESINLEHLHCVLCQGLLDTQMDVPCSLQATQFSQLISQRGAQNFERQELISDELAKLKLNCKDDDQKSGDCGGSGLCAEGGGGCGSKGVQLDDKDDVMQYLCYSCRLTMSKFDSVPDFLSNEARIMKQRSSMRNEIQDFLLQDE